MMKHPKVGDRVKFEAYNVIREDGENAIFKGVITEVVGSETRGFSCEIARNGSLYYRTPRELTKLVPKRNFKKGDRITARVTGVITEDPDLVNGDAYVAFDDHIEDSWVKLKYLKKEKA